MPARVNVTSKRPCGRPLFGWLVPSTTVPPLGNAAAGSNPNWPTLPLHHHGWPAGSFCGA